MIACLLLCFLSMLASLDLGFAMVVSPIGLFLCGYIHPPRGLIRYNHSWDTPPWCWCAWYTPFFTPCNVDMLALLALCHPFGFLRFFASLHACLHVHAWVSVSSILQSNGSMDTQSKPTFVFLGHPILLDNILVCPFICLVCFVCPHF